DDYTIEFGEKYLPKLELRRETDAFGRPAYTWAYDKKVIGTYLDDTDLVAEFTTKVTGKDLYDAITKNVMEHLYGDVVTVTIDGEDNHAKNSAVFTEDDITRTGTDTLGATEKGVLTQVFVRNVNNNDKTLYDVDIVIINTYLAIASEDYDSKNGEVDLDVYGLHNKESKSSPEFIKDETKDTTATVEDENMDVSDVKENDMFLVTVAAGKVQTMVAPEVVADATIDSFKKGKDVTVEGKTYEYADTAKYDEEVLEQYSNTNLKDTTYNVILDQYGYLIGIEQNEEADQYVFITGMNGNTSDLTTKNADANIIFLDGKMETVTVDVKKSDLPTSGPQMNTWCTYSVSSNGVYTLKQVANTQPKGWKVAQNAKNVENSDEVKIDKKNVSLPAVTGNAYGNDDTVYINVTTDVIKAATAATAGKYYHVIIDDVDSVTVGARNASMVVVNQTVAGSGEKEAEDTAGDGKGPKPISEEIYTLYKENGYIIASVVIGEDDGMNKVFAYVHSDDISRERYSKADDEWTWTREATVDGKIVELKEVGGGTDLSVLKDMEQGNWYELKLDADGNVKATDPKGNARGWAVPLTFAAFNASTNRKYINNVDDVDKAVNAEDTVIMQAVEATELTYKNGTLYTDKAQTKGFSVAPEVKTVLCLSDDKGNAYDDCDDSYTARKGLEDAIRNLDTNFKGELNVIFDKGDAVVVILVDKTGAKDGDEGPKGPEGYDSEVLALLDKNGTTDANGQVTFIATGTKKIIGAAKREAIKAAYVAAYPVDASKTEVKYEDNKAGEMVYNVYVDGVIDATYTESATGVIRTAAVPTPAELWSTTSDDDERDVKEWRPLINSGYLSTDAKFTPTGVIESDSAPTVEVTGINWITDFSVKVPGFFYVVGGSTEEAAHENCTIKEAYFISDENVLGGTNASHVNQNATGKVDAFAVIPIIRSDYTSDTHLTFQIVFRGTGTDSGKFFSPTGTEITDGKIIRAPLGGADNSVKDVLIITNKK
ncbi:MAG: hypothetical protein HFF61_12860, partial [Oscillospiraceae bacterium]|nr:hypothetical protein [Oscillospiraceae bacterium]